MILLYLPAIDALYSFLIHIIFYCRPVNEVQNFVAAQAVLANDSIANGILNFNDRGKPILEALLKDLQSNFPGKNWGGNGPILMTKVISKICNESDVSILLLFFFNL